MASRLVMTLDGDFFIANWLANTNCFGRWIAADRPGFLLCGQYFTVLLQHSLLENRAQNQHNWKKQIVFCHTLKRFINLGLIYINENVCNFNERESRSERVTCNRNRLRKRYATGFLHNMRIANGSWFIFAMISKENIDKNKYKLVWNIWKYGSSWCGMTMRFRFCVRNK